MKKSLGVSAVIAVAVGSFLSVTAAACTPVVVNATNLTDSPVNLEVFVTPVGQANLSPLTAGQSTPLSFAVPDNIIFPLHLTAQVSPQVPNGTVGGSCPPMDIIDTGTGQCGGVVQLVIKLNPGTPGSSGSHHGHGKGNAWGTYKHCFTTKADWFKFKNNPDNRHMGTSSGWCPDSTSTPPQLSCTFGSF